MHRYRRAGSGRACSSRCLVDGGHSGYLPGRPRCGFAARRQTWTACGRIAAAWANRRSAHTPWWPHGVGLSDRRLCSRCHGRSTDVLYRSMGGHRVGVGPPSSPLSCTTPTSWLVRLRMDFFDRSSFSLHAWSESRLWRVEMAATNLPRCAFLPLWVLPTY